MGKALLWFLLSASFDLIQYLYKTVVFSVLFHRRWSRNADLARAANFSNKWNYATWVIWMAKVACAGIAYWLIGKGMMAQGFSFASL